MTRLYDRLGMPDQVWQDQIDEVNLSQPVVFDIGNVAAYWREHDKTFAELSDFPNVAPPFGCYWMEWRWDRSDPVLPFDRVGVVLMAIDGTDERNRALNVEWSPGEFRWGLGMVAFVEGRGGRKARLGDWIVLVDEDGSLRVSREDVNREWVEIVLRRRGAKPDAEPDPEFRALLSDIEAARRLLDDAEARKADAEAKLEEHLDRASDELAPLLRKRILHPVLLAHSLMACKNVTYEEHDPPERLSRKRERKKGRPLVRFRTLVIDPMGGGKRSAGGRVDIGGGMTALHIVRGHFKTFTADRPLFGKRVGTYWWSSILRGKAEHGIVVKDYEVGALVDPSPPSGKVES